VLVIYGPCKTWMAWLVTEPELLATGAAVALTPPTFALAGAAFAIVVRHNTTGRKYLLCLLRFEPLWFSG